MDLPIYSLRHSLSDYLHLCYRHVSFGDGDENRVDVKGMNASALPIIFLLQGKGTFTKEGFLLLSRFTETHRHHEEEKK